MSHFTIVSVSNNKWSVNNIVPACRGCLEIDTKLLPLEGRTGEVFYKFTGVPLTDGLRYLCLVCLELLMKFDNFRKRCRSAMLSIRKIESLKPVTPTDIKKIDRSRYKYVLSRTTTECINIQPQRSQDSNYKPPQTNKAKMETMNGNITQNKTIYKPVYRLLDLQGCTQTQVREEQKTAETESQMDFLNPLLSLSQLSDRYKRNSCKGISSYTPFNQSNDIVKPIKLLPKPSVLVQAPMHPEPDKMTKTSKEDESDKTNEAMITDIKVEKDETDKQSEEMITDIKVENELDDLIVKEENLLLPVDDEDENMEDCNVDNVKDSGSSIKDVNAKDNEAGKDNENSKEKAMERESESKKEHEKSEIIEIIDEDSSSSSSSSDSTSSSSSDDESDTDGKTAVGEPEKIQIDLTSDDEVAQIGIDGKNDDKKIDEDVKEDKAVLELLTKYVAAENSAPSTAAIEIEPLETDNKLSNCETASQEDVKCEQKIKDSSKTLVSKVSSVLEGDNNIVNEQDENKTNKQELTEASEQRKDKIIKVTEVNKAEPQQAFEVNELKNHQVNETIAREENKVEHKITESLELNKNKEVSQQIPEKIDQEKSKVEETQMTETIEQKQNKAENMDVPVMQEESNVKAVEQEISQEEQQISESLEQELSNALKEIIPVEVVQEEIRTTYKVSETENFQNSILNLEVTEEVTASKNIVKEVIEEVFNVDEIKEDKKLVVEEIIVNELVDENENRGQTSGQVEEGANINILQCAILSAGIDETDLVSTPQKRRHDLSSDSDASDADTDLPDCLMGIDSEIYKNDPPLKIARTIPVKQNTETAVKDVKEKPITKRKSTRIAEKVKNKEKEVKLKKESYEVLLMEKRKRRMERKKLKKEVSNLKGTYRAKLQSFLKANKRLRKLEKWLRNGNDEKGNIARRLANTRDMVKNIRLELRSLKDEYLKKKIEEIELEVSSDDD